MIVESDVTQVECPKFGIERKYVLKNFKMRIMVVTISRADFRGVHLLMARLRKTLMIQIIFTKLLEATSKRSL